MSSRLYMRTVQRDESHFAGRRLQSVARLAREVEDVGGRWVKPRRSGWLGRAAGRAGVGGQRSAAYCWSREIAATSAQLELGSTAGMESSPNVKTGSSNAADHALCPGVKDRRASLEGKVS